MKKIKSRISTFLFYKQSIYVSGKQRSAPIQFRLIVKNELVDVYVPSSFATSTLQVQQQPSIASALKTLEFAVISFKV